MSIFHDVEARAIMLSAEKQNGRQTRARKCKTYCKHGSSVKSFLTVVALVVQANTLRLGLSSEVPTDSGEISANFITVRFSVLIGLPQMCLQRDGAIVRQDSWASVLMSAHSHAVFWSSAIV